MAETASPIDPPALLDAERGAHVIFFDPVTPLAVTVTNADEWYDVVGATMAIQDGAVGWSFDPLTGTLTATQDHGDVDVYLGVLITSDSSAADIDAVGVRVNAAASTDLPATGLRTQHTVTATYPGTDERECNIKARIRNVRTGLTLHASVSSSGAGNIISVDRLNLAVRTIPGLYGTRA